MQNVYVVATHCLGGKRWVAPGGGVAKYFLVFNGRRSRFAPIRPRDAEEDDGIIIDSILEPEPWGCGEPNSGGHGSGG